MPLPNTFTIFTDGATVTADDVNRRVVDLETFINGDIEQSDLPSGVWVNSSLITMPEYYGSPAPRVQLVSSDVHYRRELGGQNAQIFNSNLAVDYIPIMGVSSTFHVAIPDGFPSDTVDAAIRCSLFGENTNSVLDSNLATNTSLFVTFTAEIALFVDGVIVDGTVRRIYCETAGEEPIAAQNINISAMTKLSRGTHNVSVRIRPVKPGAAANFQHTVIRHRTLNIELYYL